jgi:DNA-binding MarR family transcriptional regulator
MLVLWEAEAGQGRDGVPVSELGRRLRLDSGTLTPLLKRLAERGLVSRNRSVRDERVVEVRLTDEGYVLRERARSVPGDMLCGTGIELDTLMALRDQLRALVSQLEDPGEPSV